MCEWPRVESLVKKNCRDSYEHKRNLHNFLLMCNDIINFVLVTTDTVMACIALCHHVEHLCASFFARPYGSCVVEVFGKPTQIKSLQIRRCVRNTLTSVCIDDTENFTLVVFKSDPLTISHRMDKVLKTLEWDSQYHLNTDIRLYSHEKIEGSHMRVEKCSTLFWLMD